MKTLNEGDVVFLGESKVVVDKKMPIFYNPLMVVNRDFSLLVLLALEKENLVIADPLAGSGIRSLRLLKEIGGCVSKVYVNDLKRGFSSLFLDSLKLNVLSSDKVLVFEEDANVFLNNNGSFDYVDVDPFGSPNPFLDSAIKSVRRNGVLGVTATDTSALCGSYPKACLRKYWARPLKNELMHEFGVRILIRKVQLLGAQYGKAFVPLVSYSKEHYVKIFFKCFNSKEQADSLLSQHDFFSTSKGVFGPVWLGSINDFDFLVKMKEKAESLIISSESKKLIDVLISESAIGVPFFFDLHSLGKELKSGFIPRMDDFMISLKEKGFLVSRTHFLDTALKTDASLDVVKSVFLSFKNC